MPKQAIKNPRLIVRVVGIIPAGVGVVVLLRSIGARELGSERFWQPFQLQGYGNLCYLGKTREAPPQHFWTPAGKRAIIVGENRGN
jgi:hypothetical protein